MLLYYEKNKPKSIWFQKYEEVTQFKRIDGIRKYQDHQLFNKDKEDEQKKKQIWREKRKKKEMEREKGVN